MHVTVCVSVYTLQILMMELKSSANMLLQSGDITFIRIHGCTQKFSFPSVPINTMNSSNNGKHFAFPSCRDKTFLQNWCPALQMYAGYLVTATSVPLLLRLAFTFIREYFTWRL